MKQVQPEGTKDKSMTSLASKNDTIDGAVAEYVTAMIGGQLFGLPISPGDSGTRVSRSGMNTSCTREIGSPNSWPPIMAVTYSATAPSMVSVLLLVMLLSFVPSV